MTKVIEYPWIWTILKREHLKGNSFTPEWQEEYDQILREEKAELARLQANSDLLDHGNIVGALLAFPVADGEAYYFVIQEKPLVLAHVDVGDGYCLEDWMLKGITRRDIEDRLAYRRKINEQKLKLQTKQGG